MPKTQEELEQIFAPSVENEQELEVAQTPSAENKRKKLSKSVDTCVAETKKFNAVAPEISQSQLFTAIGSAIFNVFGNANLGSVSSAEKNTLEFLWWHALCMFGILCHKHGYEWKGDIDVQSFESLRKKNGIKSGSNIRIALEGDPVAATLGRTEAGGGGIRAVHFAVPPRFFVGEDIRGKKVRDVWHNNE